MSFDSYHEYLKSDQWRKKRRRILARDHYKCQKCGSAINLEVHHIRYPLVLGTEVDDDLITLCDDCHRFAHNTDTLRRQLAREREEEKVSCKQIWVNYIKVKDFIYGGNENICSLNLLKKYAEEFENQYHIRATGYMNIQYALGYAHYLLVMEMLERGYTQDDVYLMTPLDRSTIQKYADSSREDRLRTVISRTEMRNVVNAYIGELENEQ